MLAHLSLSRFPKGSFVWIVIKGAGALTTPIGLTRKALHAHEAIKDLLTQIGRYSSILKPSNRIT